MKKAKINIVIPKVSNNSLSEGLIELTRQIRLKTGKEGGYGLGGKDGYGIEYENGVFMMHPFCWCEREDCKWCNGNAPNFLFKPKNIKVKWYKYIGRGMEQNGEFTSDWLQQCINSIWGKDDCYYEFDISPRSLQEGLMGRDAGQIVLCFNVYNTKAMVKTEMPPYTDDNINYWTLDEVIEAMKQDIGYEKIVSKIIRLDKKYPSLREKIRKDAIDRCVEQVDWFTNRINNLQK